MHGRRLPYMSACLTPSLRTGAREATAALQSGKATGGDGVIDHTTSVAAGRLRNGVRYVRDNDNDESDIIPAELSNAPK